MKDKNNIAPTNLWAGTDYSGTPNNLYISSDKIKVYNSNQYSVIGEKSLKITSLENNTSYDYVVLYRNNFNTGNLTVFIHILNKYSNNLKLRIYENNTSSYSDVNIPINENIQKISISREIGSEDVSITLRINQHSQTYNFYIDNLKLSYS